MSDDSLSHLKGWVREYPRAKDAAKKLKISPQYLSDILRKKVPVPEHVLRRIGFQRVVTTEPIKE